MSPLDRARAASKKAGLDFDADLSDFLANGSVYSSPTSFVLWHVDADVIFIYLAAGDLREFFTLPHLPTKWVSFMRRGRLLRYRYQSLKTKIHGRRTQTTKADSRTATGPRVEPTDSR